tara:strand:+ start:817 stop:1230 length:414 start_codon:yes stop_codon:yes gene_type:complete
MESKKESTNSTPIIAQSIYRNTIIGYKNGKPILFQNIATGEPMNLHEVCWKETCQGETFLDNNGIVIDKLNPHEATRYMYNYFETNVHNSKNNSIDIFVSFKKYMFEIIPTIYRGEYNKKLWNNYISSFILDMDEFV